MDYKETLNLPKTDFQMKADLPRREPEILKGWDTQGLYKRIMKEGKGRPRYILHDGPPYANGNIHMGHALNKILKDMVVKSRFMMGFATDFVPGWDCHGLPIELQVERELGRKKETISKVEIRKRCREYALKYVHIQREEFKRLGVFGQWDEPYLTMNPDYQATILRELGRFVKKGLIYRGKKPVHWCASCKTALAEAEVEYQEKESPSVYVKFELDHEGFFNRFPDLDPGLKAYILIWTTTPWTLPANLAIALNPQFKYIIVRTMDGYYIVADELLEGLVERFGWQKDHKVVEKVSFERLDGLKAHHPFVQRESLVLPGEHVTLGAGTGCVHIAPGHGQEDYELGLKYGLPIYTPVDDSGRFTKEVEGLEGRFVFDANGDIISLLDRKGMLVFKERIRHSYPHCWRCKNPIIFRATEQWFVSMDGHVNLRKEALRAIKEDITWIPSWGMERIYNMVLNRPDWCLSRQRAWGVPIPALRCRRCGESLLDIRLIERLADIFEKEGADIWFERDVHWLVPEEIRCRGCGERDFEREEDILDVWFDSGVSFAAVLERRENLKCPADLYLEGSDQHRGWFHSSLLASMATRSKPPYRGVLTHGFVVDGEGRKMSKSLGNVIAPQEVINRYGAEILRLWVAGEDYREDIRISGEILKRLSEAYRRIRNTFRFILGNLYDFDPEKDMVPYNNLTEIDRLMLHRLVKLTERILRAYRDFEFHIIYHSAHNFCTVDLSAFYLDILKDRLYTSRATSTLRRAAQTTMYHILDYLLRLLAPVLVFTTDEAWGFIPGKKKESVHLTSMPDVKTEWLDEGLEGKWDTILGIKSEISKALEVARKDKKIGHSLDAKVTVYPPDNLRVLIERELQTLKEILIVSQIGSGDGGERMDVEDGIYYESEEIKGLAVSVRKADGSKCERCWHYSTTVGKDTAHPTICERCVEALQ